MSSLARSFTIWLIVGLEVTIGAFVVSVRESCNTNTQATQALSDPVELADRKCRLLIGVWQDEYRAKRTLTIRPDGTATLVVELLGLHRLFADKLTFDEVWTLDGDTLRFRIVGGHPQDKVDFVVQLRGRDATQQLLKLTSNQCLVFDEAEQAQMDWRRVPSRTPRPTEVVSYR